MKKPGLRDRMLQSARVADFHHLKPEQVHETPNGWKVEGYPEEIPYGQELPSEDQEIYLFCRQYSEKQFADVHCFFIHPRSF